MANLFSYGDVKNHPSRSGFDLSKKLAFTAKAGELLPVYWRMTYPGDKFNFNVQHFTRTQPVETAAFTRVREYFDWYFVPLRLISKNFPQAIVNMGSNPVQATRVNASKEIVQDIPWTNLVAYGSNGYCASLTELISLMTTSSEGVYGRPLNAFGFYESACTAKLACYLGYGNFLGLGLVDADDQVGLTSVNMSDFYLEPADDVAVNLLPFFAYQKIYSDFFRFGQWEKNEPYTYNVDYYLGGNFLSQIPNSAANFHAQGYANINLFCTLRYANWNKDMFMGMLPEQQLGDVATVSIGDFSGTASLRVGSSGAAVKVGDALPSTDPASFGITFSPVSSGDPLVIFPAHPSDTLSASFDILSLRLAEATQRWREISQCADPTYREQIRAHFGVNLSAALSDKCMYIGGSANNIDISEVVNADLNASATSTPGAPPAGTALIKGKGVGTGSGSDSFTADEHGIIMCIYHAVPLLDYVITGQRKELLYTAFNDLPVPEFDRIGMESLPLNVFMNGYDCRVDSQWIPNDLSVTMGYVPRFVELKTDVDEIQGAFRSTLKSWVAPLNPSYLASWFGSQDQSNAFVTNYNFFKVNPSILDSVFGVKCNSTWDTDQFLVNCMFNISAVRNFDYDGMPY